MPKSVSATLRHAAELAPRLSHLDRRECALFGAPDPWQALTEGVSFSRDPIAILDDDGTVLTIGGTHHINDRVGFPWMLNAAPEAFSKEAARFLYKTARAHNDRSLKDYEILCGYSWAGALPHHKLLRAIGFDVSEPTTVNQNGETIPPSVFFSRSRTTGNSFPKATKSTIND